MDSGQRTSSLHVHDGHDGYGGVLCVILGEKRDGGATGGRWFDGPHIPLSCTDDALLDLRITEPWRS